MARRRTRKRLGESSGSEGVRGEEEDETEAANAEAATMFSSFAVLLPWCGHLLALTTGSGFNGSFCLWCQSSMRSLAKLLTIRPGKLARWCHAHMKVNKENECTISGKRVGTAWAHFGSSNIHSSPIEKTNFLKNGRPMHSRAL